MPDKLRKGRDFKAKVKDFFKDNEIFFKQYRGNKDIVEKYGDGQVIPSKSEILNQVSV